LSSVSSRSPVSIPGRTGRRPWSTQLLRDLASKRYPGEVLSEQVRLGPTSSTLSGVEVSPALEAMLRVNNWFADGLIIRATEVLLIESKMRANPSAVGQVLFYMRLGFSTPALQASMSIPFVPVVLFAEDDRAVRLFAQQLGCRVEIFTPTWIADYLTQVQFRNRSTAPQSPPEEPS